MFGSSEGDSHIENDDDKQLPLPDLIFDMNGESQDDELLADNITDLEFDLDKFDSNPSERKVTEDTGNGTTRLDTRYFMETVQEEDSQLDLSSIDMRKGSVRDDSISEFVKDRSDTLMTKQEKDIQNMSYNAHDKPDEESHEIVRNKTIMEKSKKQFEFNEEQKYSKQETEMFKGEHDGFSRQFTELLKGSESASTEFNRMTNSHAQSSGSSQICRMPEDSMENYFNKNLNKIQQNKLSLDDISLQESFQLEDDSINSLIDSSNIDEPIKQGVKYIMNSEAFQTLMESQMREKIEQEVTQKVVEKLNSQMMSQVMEKMLNESINQQVIEQSQMQQSQQSNSSTIQSKPLYCLICKKVVQDNDHDDLDDHPMVFYKNKVPEFQRQSEFSIKHVQEGKYTIKVVNEDEGLMLVGRKQMMNKSWTIINTGKTKMPPFEVRSTNNYFHNQGIKVMRKLNPGQSMKIMMNLRAPDEEGRFKVSFNLFVDGNIQVKNSRLDLKMKVLDQQAVSQFDPIISAQQGAKSFEKSTLVQVMQLFREPQDLNNLVSSRYQKNIEQKLKKNKASFVSSQGSFSMNQSNLFEYEAPQSPTKHKVFNMIPPRKLSPPKFGEVVVQEYEDLEDRDKQDSEIFVPQKVAMVFGPGVYEQRLKLLEGTSEEKYIYSLREMFQILTDEQDENKAFERNIQQLRKNQGDLNNSISSIMDVYK